MNGTFSEWDRERSLELDREERQLVERARAQGFELVIKRPLLQVIFSGIATASMLGLSAVTTMLALLFLYYFFGNIVLLLSACTLFFLAGLWFGSAVTARKFHSKIYSAFIPDDGDSNNRSDSQPQTF
ncbi:MAG TPA: hypothetical protein VH186_34160 [Chloroflexia bacterium]|nr:hypothetical protein [Chloroflexia bacterium]